MTKLKCLLVNFYERNSPISTMTGILDACKDGKNSEIWTEISVKNNNTSVKRVAFDFLMPSHSVFYDLGKYTY